MINPIHKVLSVMRACRVRCLLMGGQACILYGAAEFSRDADFALLASPENLKRLKRALKELDAECVAVPALARPFLLKGHAVHFRCRHPAAEGLRVDVMSKLRGVADFPVLWRRRVTLQVARNLIIEAISLPDLVLAKKTQRDKDWPMIRRLVEADYAGYRLKPRAKQIRFWLQESRTPEMLIELAAQYPRQIDLAIKKRPLLAEAKAGNESGLERLLLAEELREREEDRAYWLPLRKELEQLRHQKNAAR